MKVVGTMIRDTVKVMSVIRTVTPMKDNFNLAKLMVKESTHGRMGKCMMANGKLESKRDMESGEAFMVIHTLENGKIAKLMGMEFIIGRMVTDMKESGNSA